MTRHRSSAAPLAWLYAGLIAYASLYPFVGWTIPGAVPWAFLSLPWPRWWTLFDVVSNLLGYLPFGALVWIALLRTGRHPLIGLASAVALAALLSGGMESLQNYLPQRVASNVDLALNVAGAAIGAALMVLAHVLGGVERWQTVRDRWFISRSAGGMALLLLWPIGLLFPTPVPLGLGQVIGRLQEALALAVEGTPAQAWTEDWLASAGSLNALAPASEVAAIALGLMAPCLVAFAITRDPRRRLMLVVGAVLLGFAATTLSTALNFGPQHALAWRTPDALAGFAIGSVAAAGLAWLPRRAVAGVALVVLTAGIALVSQAPADPYFAESLQGWAQGRFIRFHGAAQWVGWLWPYAAVAYVLMRLGARDEG